MNMISQNELEKRRRQEQRFIDKETQTAAKYLRRIAELPGAPESITPFLSTLERIYVNLQGVYTNRPTVGTYCVMTPQELIYAAGAMPVKLCSGNYTAFSIGDDVTPRDACPLVKAVAGTPERSDAVVIEGKIAASGNKIVKRNDTGPRRRSIVHIYIVPAESFGVILNTATGVHALRNEVGTVAAEPVKNAEKRVAIKRPTARVIDGALSEIRS